MACRSLLVVAFVGSILVAGCGTLTGSSQDGTPTLRTEDVRPAGGGAKGDPNAAIAWFDDLDTARIEAKAGQVVFVDVYTDWCSWCKHMDKKVFTDPSVRALASNHVFVKLNAEDGGKGEAFAKKNGISGFPTLLIYSSDGKQLANQPGAFRQASEFVTWFNAAAARAA